MSLGPNGNIGARYITQDEWNKEWEEAPYRIVKVIKKTLFSKIESTNQRNIKDLEETLYTEIRSELNKLKNLAYIYAESG